MEPNQPKNWTYVTIGAIIFGLAVIAVWLMWRSSNTNQTATTTTPAATTPAPTAPTQANQITTTGAAIATTLTTIDSQLVIIKSDMGSSNDNAPTL